MSSVDKAATIDVDLKVKGKKTIVTHISMEAAIGSYPVVTATVQLGDEAGQKATELTTKQVVSTMGGFQNTMFSERTSPDFTLSIKVNGNEMTKGSINFKGFIIDPSYVFSTTHTTLQVSALPDYAMMDSLNLSIYHPPTNTGKYEEGPTLKEADNIPDLIKKTIDRMMKQDWKLMQPMIEQLPGGESGAIQNAHKVNQQVISHFKKLIKNSSSTFGWENAKDALIQDNAPRDKNLRSTIVGTLMSNNGSFLTNINYFASRFQQFYVPKWDDVGCLMSKSKIYDNASNLKAPLVSLSIGAGNGLGLFPNKYVSVQTPFQYINTGYYKPQPACVVFPPDGASTGGSMVKDEGPSWIDGYFSVEAVEKSGKSTRKPKIKKGKKIKQELKKQQNKTISYQKHLQNILKEWAKCLYCYQALAGSTASITVPLNLDYEVGKRYSVTDTSGTKLFEGLLARVSHSITCSTQPDATTILFFDFITLPNFRLPGL